MNLRGVDLNLLPVLHALLEEGHVSRAAARIGLSQPAASSALERCRALFGDPLLERAGARMRLTPKGDALRGPIADALAAAERALGMEAPDLRTVSASVRVDAADAVSAALARGLPARVAAAAPGVDLIFRSWRGGEASVAALARGEADLAIGVLPPLGDEFRVEETIRQDYVVAMRAEHPAAEAFGVETWLSHPHVVVSGDGSTRGTLDEVLGPLGLKRRVGVVAPSFLLVPDLLRHSDLLALLPRMTARADAAGLVLHEPPLAVPGFTLGLARHRRRVGDPATRFVAEAAIAVLREGVGL